MNSHAGDISAQLPESLGQWYKPQNKRQVWLHTMFAMRRELQAIEEYAAQGDLPRLKKWSDRLLEDYRGLADMVPEWRDELELEIAKGLEKAVKQKDFSRIRWMNRKLGRSCRGCHIDYRVLATLRYRTADFKPLKLMDGNQELTHRRFKDELTRALNRVKIAIEDKTWKTAADSIGPLESKFKVLGKTCNSCHKDDDAPRERILGKSTTEQIQQLRKALAGKDFKMAGRRLGGLAVDVCARCHGVHRTLSEVRRDLFRRQLR